MLERRVVCLAMFSLFALLGTIEHTEAALSPAKIAELKKAATDVFEVEVLDVKVTETESAKKPTLVKARIVAVERSSGSEIGDVIEINSYIVSTTDIARPEDLVELIGPSAPTLLKQGWKGTVYLRAKDSKTNIKRYGIAAFGHSFVPATRGPQKPNKAVESDK